LQGSIKLCPVARRLLCFDAATCESSSVIPAHVLALGAIFRMQKRRIALVSRATTVDPSTTYVLAAHPGEAAHSKFLGATTLLFAFRLALGSAARCCPNLPVVVGQQRHLD